MLEVDPTARSTAGRRDNGYPAWVPDAWLTVAEAARRYPASEATIRRWTREGSLIGNGADLLLVSQASLERRHDSDRNWVSWAEATRMIGCSEPTVQRLIQSGQLITRQAARGVPSLRRDSVEQAAKEWQAEQERRQRDRESRMAAPAKSDPPAGGDVWVPTEVAAHALGLTPNRVRQLVASGRLPGTKKANKLWFRRADVEVAAAARAFKRSAQGTVSP